MRPVNAAAVRDAQTGPMETKDTFMRFVVLGSIVLVGGLALLVRMKGG